MEIFFDTLGFLLALFVFFCFIVIFLNADRIIVVNKETYNEIKKYGFNIDSYLQNLIKDDIKKREMEKEIKKHMLN